MGSICNLFAQLGFLSMITISLANYLKVVHSSRRSHN